MALPFAARLAAFIARPDRLGRNVAMKREQLIPLANYLKDLTPGTRVSATALGKTFGTKRERIPELAKALDLDIKFGEGKMLKGMKNPYMKEYFEKLVPGSLSGLTKIEKRIIDKNYKSIPVARLAADLTNVPTGTTQSPTVLAKYKQINRYLKATGKEGLNFGIDDLALVKGCEITGEGFARSKSGRPILEKLQRFETMQEALADCDIVIGTSGIRAEGDKRWFRAPQNVKKINELIDSRDKPALVFGRENYGLYKDELALCETTVTIPTSPDYPVLNLSHAVGILLYEIYYFCWRCRKAFVASE